MWSVCETDTQVAIFAKLRYRFGRAVSPFQLARLDVLVVENSLMEERQVSAGQEGQLLGAEPHVLLIPGIDHVGNAAKAQK